MKGFPLISQGQEENPQDDIPGGYHQKVHPEAEEDTRDDIPEGHHQGVHLEAEAHPTEEDH